MRAIVVKQPGGPEVLQLGEVPDPQPREGDLIVRVRAAGVNRADLHQRLGRYPPPPGEPDTIGLEIAGEVERPAGGAQPRDPVVALPPRRGHPGKAPRSARPPEPAPQTPALEGARHAPRG